MRAHVAVFAAIVLLAGCGQAQQTNSLAAAPEPMRETGVIDPAIAAKSELTREDLVRVLVAIDGFRPKDQFSPAFDPSPIRGKPFQVVYGPSKDGFGATTAFYWRYDVAKQRITVTFSQESLLSAPGTPVALGGPVRSFELTSEIKELEGYVAENAFGAKRDIKKHKFNVSGLVDFQRAPSSAMRRGQLEWVIEAPPESARSIAPALTVVIAGKVEPGPDGELAACLDDHHSPTIQFPNEHDIHTCYIATRVQSVELMGVPDGVAVTRN